MKYDGFRSLVYVEPSGVRLISRNGNRFATFDGLGASLGFFIRAKSAILDGEIARFHERGESQFNDLLFRRADRAPC